MSRTISSTSFGAYEARTHFSELLGRVEQGDEITITRHGVPVAYLVPAQRKATLEQRRTAIQAMRKLAKTHHLGGLQIKKLIAEGRR
jgi:prevent-host-death family protein